MGMAQTTDSGYQRQYAGTKEPSEQAANAYDCVIMNELTEEQLERLIIQNPEAWFEYALQDLPFNEVIYAS